MGGVLRIAVMHHPTHLVPDDIAICGIPPVLPVVEWRCQGAKTWCMIYDVQAYPHIRDSTNHDEICSNKYKYTYLSSQIAPLAVFPIFPPLAVVTRGVVRPCSCTLEHFLANSTPLTYVVHVRDVKDIIPCRCIWISYRHDVIIDFIAMCSKITLHTLS